MNVFLGAIVSVLAGFSAAEIDLLVKSGDAETLRLLDCAISDPLYAFSPRPDDVGEYEEQSSFVDQNYWFDKAAGHYRFSDPVKFKIQLGGTGSGKTTGAAHKTGRHVLEIPPPRDYCPFWIIAESYDQCCRVCWQEKLSTIIPEECIAKIDWYRERRKWPFAVMLKHPHDPNRVGWVLEFKSYEQGIGGMKSASIGGYWFNEEAPFSLVAEVHGRCREYDSPGWADFTPIENKDPEWANTYENPPPGWQFYHLNTSKNFYLPDGWFDGYIASIPEDMRELRTIGKFTTLMGAVYKEFRKSIHVIDPFRVPKDWRRIRGLDFGHNNPTGCVWVAKDGDGRHYIYDEYYRGQSTIASHAKEINARAWDYSQPWYGPTYSDHDAQWRGELAIHGIPCTPANKSILQGIEYLRSLMLLKSDDRPQLYIFNTCKNLIKEIQGYRWPEGTTGKNAREVPIDKDDHLCDAMRYAIFSDYRRGDDKVEARTVLPDHRRHGVQFTRG